MPWNFPFWQVLRFACAALVAGNAAVLKHSPERDRLRPGHRAAVRRRRRRRTAHLFTTLVIADADLAEATPRIIGDPRVAAVTLTGSERAGDSRRRRRRPGAEEEVLELGGSDPFVVLDDADLEAAAAAAVKSRFGNGGQSCIAAKRFIVAESVADEFARLVSSRSRCCRSATRPRRAPTSGRWPGRPARRRCTTR